MRDETTDFVTAVEQRTGTVNVYVELRKFLDHIKTFKEEVVYRGNPLETEPGVVDVITLPENAPTAAGQTTTVNGLNFTSVDDPVWIQQNEILSGAILQTSLPENPTAGDKVKIAVTPFWSDMGYSPTPRGGFEIPYGTFNPLSYLNDNRPSSNYLEGQDAYLYLPSGYYWNFEVHKHEFYEAFSRFVWSVDDDNFVFSEEIDTVFDNGNGIPTDENILAKVRNHFLDNVKELLSITTEPSGTSGDMYYNSTEEKIKIHDGSTWVDYTGVDLIYSYSGTLYYYDTALEELSDEKVRHSGVIKYHSTSLNKDYYYNFTVVAVYNIPSDMPLLIDGLYKVEFNSRNNTFDLSIRDFFFDYHNEPSILMTVTFANNPDYDKIANCRFGSTFGSENRLFLAGNAEYPNIDRYNVSNDLLGNNVKSQSYELTYFPSKNYRVLGGKAAINGYVVATDNILYVTKENYPNDSKLFIRERMLDENGVVGYREYKTNISKTPLNENCLARFNNDILMLTKDGLYAVELSQNVMTDERLMKLRSGFVNKDLMSNVNGLSFLIENNEKLYISAGNYLYVADSRFFHSTDEIEIGSNSYEMVKWSTPSVLRHGRFVDNVAYFVSGQKTLYVFGEKDYDEDVKYLFDEAFNLHYMSDGRGNCVTLSEEIDSDKYADYVFRFTSENLLKIIGVLGTHYTFATTKIVISDFSAFRDIADGMTIYGYGGGSWHSIVVEGYEDSEHLEFLCSDEYEKIAMKMNGIDLYITAVLTSGIGKAFLFDIYKPDVILQGSSGSVFGVAYDFISGDVNPLSKMESLTGNIAEVEIESVILEYVPVEMTWKSAITSLGSDVSEKTMFKAFFNVIKTGRENHLYFGRRTMRSPNWEATKEISLANPMDFSMVDFGNFGISSFAENTISIPVKENNFMYIQFLIIATGQIELDGFTIVFKENRLSKTIS